MTMQNQRPSFFSAPVFPEDDGKTRSAYYINAIVLVSIVFLILFFGIRVASGNRPLETLNLVLLSIILALVLVWAIMKAGAVRLAGFLHIAMIWIVSTFLAWNESGIHGAGFVIYFVVILLAGLLLGVRTAVGVAVLSIISGFVLASAENAGYIIPITTPAMSVAWQFTVLFILSTVFMVLTITSLQRALANAKANATNLETSNKELSALRDALEARIQDRTSSLEKRASQLQIVSSLARSIATMQDLDTLLPNITRLVSEQFGFYHTGIFLLDDAGEYAVLKAANSTGGRRMLNRGHRLALNGNSIVGYVASRGEARIARDVGQDVVYFNNPDLPETCAEMALPLRVHGHVIGALDVQSKQTDAFVQEDISVLSTLADQVAIAIENARLFGEAQKALAESQSTYEKYVKQSWSSFVQQARHTGFTFDGKHVTPLDAQSERDYIKALPQTGSLSIGKIASEVAVPIRLRGQTIGVIDVRSKKGEREWSRDEITLLEAAAERAALALETARLVESAQRRAARERAIGDISSRIGGISSFEFILQTAVEELGRKIGGATEVTMEISSDEDELNRP